MTHDEQARQEQLRLLFQRLRQIMQAEGESNWIAGVEAILERLNDHVSEERWREVQSLYKTMHRGASTFSDYHVWRDDFDARLEANRELDSIRQRIWTLMEVL